MASLDGSARNKQVAFVGLGRMGWPMAANVARSGVRLRVHNRTMGRTEAFLAEHPGVEAGTTLEETVRGAAFVITMLADGEAVDDVLLGPAGVFAAAGPGTIVVEMSTIGPVQAIALGEAAAAAGCVLVDAPVSGSTATAEAARLLVMAGGDRAAVDAARSVLETIGSNVMHVGPLGAGATMKLVANTVVYGLNQSVSEALVLAERAGLDRLLTYEVFANSAVAAPFVHYRREAFERPGDVPVAFRLELAARDLQLILELGDAVGADLRQSETNLRLLEETAAAGMWSDDVSAVAQYLRDKNRAPPLGVPERGG